MSVIDSIRSDGGTPSVGSIATELSSMPTVQRASVLLALQQTHGNRYVQRVVAGIQAKLKIGQPGDIYEQEADRVADAVMRMPEPQVQRRAEDEEKLPRQNKTITPIRTLTLQRQDDEEEEELKKKKKEEEEEEILQTNGIQNHTPEVTPDVESRIQAMRGSGQPLPEITRALMGQRFGYDFSQVRVHTGGQAAETAKTLNARAFTVGQDIVFGAGQYAPSVPAGQRLVAHELTHVVQQNVAKSTTQRTIQRNDDEKSKLQKLDEMLSSVDVPEEEVIILLGQLSTAEKATVLRGYKERIANALNIGEMVRAVSHLNPILTVKLNWVRVAATYTSQIDYSDIKGMITSASQPERDALKTDTWRDFFVEVCTNKTMV
ncbi:MAG: DUF4157 domain-containing protein, partial [Proteobacteria bacterium]|nr:DUF4157 domain-containing protein [Pseudomonadota bacterium]